MGAQRGGEGTLLAEPSAFLWNVPMLVLSLLVLNQIGRPFEFFLTGYKLPFIICVLSGLTAVLTRGLKSLNSSPGRCLTAFVCWMLMCVPLSTWRGGSTTYVAYYIGLNVVLFMLAASAPRSLRDVKKTAYVVVGSFVFYSLVARTRGGEGDRLSISATFGNSDDVALLAGFVLPFAVLAALQFKSFPVKCLFLIGGIGYLVRAIGMTGTRAALPALFAMVVVYFVRGSSVQRLGLIVMTVVGSLLMVIVLPGAILTRFGTIFKSFDSEAVMSEASSDEAMASVAERRDLLKDAVLMTVTHPIFGVGPGEYPDYRAQFLDKKSGGHKRYFPSHNTYLQVSSEDGIPGLICYVGFLVAAYVVTRRAIRLNRPGTHPDWQVGYQIGTALEAALVYFAVCAGFMTCERHPHQFVVAGMAVALYRISTFRINQHKIAMAAASPVSAVQQSPMSKPVPASISTTPQTVLARAGTFPSAPAPRSRSALRRPR